MNFLARGHIFMLVFLSSAVYGTIIDPLIQNKIVVAGAKNTEFTCSSDFMVNIFLWMLIKVGGDEILLVSGDEIIQPADFGWFITGQESHLIVKVADLSTAGVYFCKEQPRRFAQFVVIVDEPTCKYVTKPNEKTPCDKISEMSCTVRYAANDSYVVANMTWSSVGTSSSFNSPIDTSTSGNITTAVSTLKLTKPENKESLSKFRCATSFSLKDNLPSEFATNRLDYNKECKPNDDACTEEKTTPSGESVQSAKTDDTTTTSGKQGNKTTPGGKQGSSGKPDDKLKVVGGPGDDSGNSAGGLSVGSFQRNIGILCVASIAIFFLIDA